MGMYNKARLDLSFTYLANSKIHLWYHKIETEFEICLSLFSSTSVHEQTKVYVTSVCLHPLLHYSSVNVFHRESNGRSLEFIIRLESKLRHSVGRKDKEVNVSVGQ